MKKMNRTLLAMCFLALISAGCEDDDGDSNDDSNGGVTRDGGADASIDASLRLDGSIDASRDSAADAGDAAVALTEAQVVGVVTAINTGEVQAGEVAAPKATSEAVRNYATMMVTMHTAANVRAAALGIAPADSAQSGEAELMATTVRQTLQSTPAGAAFDSAYIDSQVAMHTTALRVIDTILLPNAKTPALTAELTTTRGEVSTHLQQAQALRSDAGT